jgi:hypothetical protein
LNGEVRHLTVAAVKAIHAEVLAAHGGAAGLRDEALLESAVAAPQATMMGQPLISHPIELAAAYLFYLCRNHARSSTGTSAQLWVRAWSFSNKTNYSPPKSWRPMTGKSSSSTSLRASSTATRRRGGCANWLNDRENRSRPQLYRRLGVDLFQGTAPRSSLSKIHDHPSGNDRVRSSRRDFFGWLCRRDGVHVRHLVRQQRLIFSDLRLPISDLPLSRRPYFWFRLSSQPRRPAAPAAFVA